MTANTDRCLNCRQTRKDARENGAECATGRFDQDGEWVEERSWSRHSWLHPNREVPLAVIAGRVRRWITQGDVAYFREKARRVAGWARQDWDNSLENVLIDREMWKQDIPFSGDARAYIERGEKRRPLIPASIHKETP